MMYTMSTMNTTLSATEARNRFFELLDLAFYKREEFTIKKEGKVTARLIPADVKKSPEEIRKTLAEFRKVFAKPAKRKYWSVIDTPTWKRKERKYLKNLSKGIIG